MNPTCCNKPATPYFQKYGDQKRPHSIEWGFRCLICGRIRIPTGEAMDMSYMNAMPAVREAGMEWEMVNLNQATL